MDPKESGIILSGTNHGEGHSGGRRVLLVTSAAPAQSPFSTREKRPPIGIGFLISVLRDAGHKVSFIDNYLQPSDFLETGYLQKNAIDFVGIYANTICFRDTLRMLHAMQRLRQAGQWRGKIVVGGPHAAVAPQTIPGFVDFIVQGEGEYAMRDIVAGKVTDRIVRYPRINDLDTLPMPAWDCFVDLPYEWSMKLIGDAPVFTMNTSRGCPFRCAFCSVNSVWGRKYTSFSAERIVSDIEHLVHKYGAKGIYFREDNFTLNEGRLREFCGLLHAEKPGHLLGVRDAGVQPQRGAGATDGEGGGEGILLRRGERLAEDAGPDAQGHHRGPDPRCVPVVPRVGDQDDRQYGYWRAGGDGGRPA